MVIQQLETVKAILEHDPPDIEAALRELDIAMQVAIQEYELHNPLPPSNESWLEPVRPNDALLKEFGW